MLEASTSEDVPQKVKDAAKAVEASMGKLMERAAAFLVDKTQEKGEVSAWFTTYAQTHKEGGRVVDLIGKLTNLDNEGE